MKLIDIKNEILQQFKKLTIDDFYVEPNLTFAKDIFCRMTNLQTDKQIEEYLVGEFPKTRVELPLFSLEKEIIKYNKLLAKVDKEIEKLIKEIAKLKDVVDGKMNENIDFPNQTSAIQTELHEIEKEIQLLKPLANKSPYNNQIKVLESKKVIKVKKLSSFSVMSTKLKSEIESLQLEINTVKINIQEKKSEKSNIQSLINQKGQELDQLKKDANTFYKTEYLSLEFLFKILLQNKIVETVIHFPDPNKGGIKRLDESSEIDLDTVGKVEVKLDYWRIDFSDVCKYLIEWAPKSINIPQNWRRILFQTLSKPLPNISGIISNPTKEKLFFIEKKLIELSDTDSSALLSLKIASQTNHSLETAENKIILALSGGLTAIIAFREKGEIINRVQQNSIEIYVNCLKYKNQFVSRILYYQTGYADSKIEIITPGAYYIVCDNFVIEIEFCSAPMLFDTNSIAKFSPNISSKAKIEDEIEEEDRRLADWDD